MISVDAKKKELSASTRTAATEYRPKGEPDRLTSTTSPTRTPARPPVRDLRPGRERRLGLRRYRSRHLRVRRETIRRWWQLVGQAAYPSAIRLLISADGGGSNGYPGRPWKTELATLASETGLHITVCHLPPGTSKWNKIEHRLFTHISMNWRGRPLTSHEVIVNLIATTTTRTGLTVHAEHDDRDYPSGIKITDQQMPDLETKIHRHDFHGEWNYTLNPSDTP